MDLRGGATSKGRGENGREGSGRGMERRGRERKGVEGRGMEGREREGRGRKRGGGREEARKERENASMPGSFSQILGHVCQTRSSSWLVAAAAATAVAWITVFPS